MASHRHHLPCLQRPQTHLAKKVEGHLWGPLPGTLRTHKDPPHPPPGERSRPSTTRHTHPRVMGVHHTHKPRRQRRTLGPRYPSSKPRPKPHTATPSQATPFAGHIKTTTPSPPNQAPPPIDTKKGAVTRVVCPPGPPVYMDSCTAARASGPGDLRAGKRSARPGAPPTARPVAVGGRSNLEQHHPCQRNQGVRTAPSRVRRLATCCCCQKWATSGMSVDLEVACPDRQLPRRAQRQAPPASPPGPGAPGDTLPHARVQPSTHATTHTATGARWYRARVGLRRHTGHTPH